MLRIIADSTCDISKEDARKMGIQIVPISVRFGNEEFLDGVEITHEEFYTRLAECDELPKTSQPSPDTFMKVFNEAVAAGDDVLGIINLINMTLSNHQARKQEISTLRSVGLRLILQNMPGCHKNKSLP